MMNLLVVGLGGAIGSMARYSLTGALAKYNANFPLPIMLVNISGSFLLALIVGMLARHSQGSQTTYLLLTVGFCGGFTTFSTFSQESWQLVSSGKLGLAAIYIFGSVVFSILAFGLGLYLTRA